MQDPPCHDPERQGRAELFLRDLNALFAEATRLTDEAAFLQRILDAGVRAVGGKRGFLALVSHDTGELTVSNISGEGWTERGRRMRLHLANETTRGITGHVALTTQPYITGNVNADPYYLKFFDDVVSEIAVPILTPTGQTRGVINIDSPRPDAFDADDCAHLVSLAQAASVALGVEGFRARESAIIEIGNTLAKTLDIESLMQKVVEIAAGALQYDYCAVFLLDPQTEQVVLRAARGSLADKIGTASYQIGQGILGWIAQHGDPVRLEEPHRDPRWANLYNELPEEEIGPFLAVPIISRDKIIGVLRVMRRKSHASWFSNRFTETDERVLTTIASQLGTAIENARNFEKLLRSERMAAWGDLSAKSAHMIGNRLFALKGDLNELTYILEPMARDDHRKELEAIVASMNRGVERLEEILREFRDFVVATQLNTGECDINAVLRETIEESYPRRSNVKLEVDLGEGVPLLQCDAKKLKRAFSELIENSLSFQPDGGMLRIASRLLMPEELAEIRLAHSRRYVRIEFSDAGPGVPKEIKERIFQPFFTSRVKGMGLGLSIVKGIIEAHQGLLRETGEPGQGARFLIFLPVNGK
jgi:signal transduction histidine kinase